MKPPELLDAATQVLERRDFSMNGAWPRAVALLARQALEQALDVYWLSTLPGMQGTNRRTQATCLRNFISDRGVADGVVFAWTALSRACHHHPYELAPTAAELSAWLTSVERLVVLIDRLKSDTASIEVF